MPLLILEPSSKYRLFIIFLFSLFCCPLNYFVFGSFSNPQKGVTTKETAVVVVLGMIGGVAVISAILTVPVGTTIPAGRPSKNLTRGPTKDTQEITGVHTGPPMGAPNFSNPIPDTTLATTTLAQRYSFNMYPTIWKLIA